MKNIQIKKIALYTIGGVINYSLKSGITFFFTEFINLKYYYSYIIALISVIIFSFYYNFHITFKNKTEKTKKFITYTSSLFMFMITDYLLVIFLTSYLRYHYLSSIIFVTIVLFVAKYIVYSNAVFRERSKTQEQATKNKTKKQKTTIKPTYKNIGGNVFKRQKSKHPLIQFADKQFLLHLNRLINLTHFAEKEKVLDIGCGEGMITSKLKNKYKFQITGEDLDKDTIKLATKTHQNINFRTGSILNLKHKNNSFDLVIATETLEHVDKPDKAIQECKRVSKKYCIFTVPNEPWWRIANISRGYRLKYLGNSPGHIQHWTRSEFKKLLRKHFKKVKIINCWMLWNMALCRK